MKPTKLLILDCDGVLVRSERANLAYYNRIFEVFGLPLVEEIGSTEGRLLHTLSTPQVIDAFFPEEVRPEVRSFADSLDFMDFIAFLDPEPGWREYLGSVRGRLKVCVATNRGRSAFPVLESVGLARLVDLIVTVNDVARPKPAPDMLLKALDSFWAGRDEALYVGDSELDRTASRAAGIPFVGFRTEGDFSIFRPADLENVVEYPKGVG